MIKTIVKANTYMDSIFLMNVGKEIMKISGVRNAVAVMGTDMNKTVLEEFGGLSEEAAAATPNDLILSMDIENEALFAEAQACIVRLLAAKPVVAGETLETVYRTLRAARDAEPAANMAIISVPGEFAAAEGRAALERGMHVFMFSDNVPLEDELELKRLAQEKGLFVMGPGCGTAVINNVSLGLMSKVRPGNIGIVGASGSGIHEIAMLAHRYGAGISQAIGTGGRDLSKEVGGRTMLRGIAYLEQDADTAVIVLVSKPPHPDTMEHIFQVVQACKKPVVIFFLGGDAQHIRTAGAYAAATLEDAARIAVALSNGEQVAQADEVANCIARLQDSARKERETLLPNQKYLRGVFCGGTHSEEAVLLLQGLVPDLHSNLHFGRVSLLEHAHTSVGNALVDMGDEEFTKGKPHPVMDPSILVDRLVQEAHDETVGVILFDLLFGHAVHADPVGAIAPALEEIQRIRRQRNICLVASLCGTDLDPQNIADQERRLKEYGVHILPSNAQAAIFAGLIVS